MAGLPPAVVVAAMDTMAPVATAATAALEAVAAALEVLSSPIGTDRASAAAADSARRWRRWQQGRGRWRCCIGRHRGLRSLGTTVTFTNSSTDAGSLTAGSGGASGLGTGHNGTAGSAAGGALFLMGGNTTFNVTLPNTTEVIAGSIAQSAASSITKTGLGTLVLSAANNYSGGTTVTAPATCNYPIGRPPERLPRSARMPFSNIAMVPRI